MRKFRIISIITLLTLLTIGTSTQSASAKIAVTQKPSHCVANIDPIRPGERESKVNSFTCFDTLAASIAFATNGQVQLPSTASRQQVNQALLSVHPNGGNVLALFYDWQNYASDSYVVASAVTCAGYTYGESTFQAGWDNRIESAVTYSNCNHAKFWDYTNWNYAGAFIDCGTACSTMGVMNNAASSWQVTG